MPRANKRTDPHPRVREKAALLDALIDEELSRPDGEQDPDAVAEWNTMIDELTGGAYRPTRREKRRLLRAMKARMSARRKEKRGEKRRIRPRFAAAVVCVLLALLLLPAAAFAKEIRTALDELFLRMKPQINALEEGESLVVHTEDADYLIVKGDFVRFQTPEELADYLGVPVLWPGWLPEGVEAGEILWGAGFSDASFTLIPYQNGFSFSCDLTGKRDPFPMAVSVTVCGEETEFAYYLNGDGSGGGNFFHEGLLYTIQFPSLGDAAQVLNGLTETEGGGQ